MEPRPLSLCDDFRTLPARAADDIGALVTTENAVFLGTAAAAALVLRNNVDDRVRHDTDEHGPRWGHFSDNLADLGDAFPFQISLLAGMYATSLWQQDDDLHELTLTMFTSYKFTVLTGVGLQYATGTHHAGGGAFNLLADSGFPSVPTATSFALASVVDTRFGWRGGVPAYLLAGLIGCSEIDQHQHRVSDVVFGAALGYAIGKSIAALHYAPDAPFKLVPLMDLATGTQGLGFEYTY